VGTDPGAAVATGVEASGAEKGTDMAVVTLRGADGRVALPAFTSLTNLTDWHREARPLPITATKAGVATLFEKADLLVIDAAGPVTFLIEGVALHALANGRGPLPITQDSAVLAALRAHLDAESAVRTAVLVERDDEADLDGVLALTLTDTADGDREAPARRLCAALAGDPVLRERLERGLDVAVLPAGGRLSAGVILIDRD
jgi:hypothetical protein